MVPQHERELNQTRPLDGAKGPLFGERFRVIRELGAGAMGQVYLAEDTKLLRRVAIKSIRAEHRSSAILLQRIKRECLLHARIGAHPHIVTLFDLLDSTDQLLIVMEYVEGEALDAVLKRAARLGVPMEPRRCIEIVLQCLEALAHTHRNGIVHRDIKPANIILDTQEPDRPCAKLTDFGIARLEEDDPLATTLTQPGARSPGTPLYMAPEQIDSGTYGPVTSAADLYAVGVVLYHMLSGAPPFTGTMTDIFNGHLNFVPKPITLDRGCRLNPGLEAVLHKAMAKQPGQRYASADAFAVALRPFLDHAVIAPSRRVPVGRRKTSWARQILGWGAALGIVVALGLAGAGYWRVWQEHRTTPLPAATSAVETAVQTVETVVPPAETATSVVGTDAASPERTEETDRSDAPVSTDAAAAGSAGAAAAPKTPTTVTADAVNSGETPAVARGTEPVQGTALDTSPVPAPVPENPESAPVGPTEVLAELPDITPPTMAGSDALPAIEPPAEGVDVPAASDVAVAAPQSPVPATTATVDEAPSILALDAVEPATAEPPILDLIVVEAENADTTAMVDSGTTEAAVTVAEAEDATLETVKDAAPPATEPDETAIEAASPVAAAPRTHVVKAGETLGSIAKKYGLRVEDLIRWNGLKENQILPEGRMLFLYDRFEGRIPAEADAEKPSPGQVFKEDLIDVLDKSKEGIKNLGRKVKNLGK